MAEAAAVSRATAYRYFPSQAALVQAVVDEGLGPILNWQSAADDPRRRVAELLDTSMPRIEAFEATFKAALKLSLDQWARRQAGTLGTEPQFTRGHRVDLLKDAIAPLKGTLPGAGFERLAQALSLVFGVEVLIVLKDIWGLDGARHCRWRNGRHARWSRRRSRREKEKFDRDMPGDRGRLDQSGSTSFFGDSKKLAANVARILRSFRQVGAN